MLVNIVRDNAEEALITYLVQATKQGKLGCAIHFNFSQKNIRIPESDFVLTVSEILEGRPATAFFCDNGDVFLALTSAQSSLVNKIVDVVKHKYNMGFQPFHAFYDFSSQGESLRMLCQERLLTLGKINQAAHVEQIIPPQVSLRYSQDQKQKFELLKAQRSKRTDILALVVEDQPFSRQLLMSTLQRQAKVIACGSSRDALTLYLNRAPDIVFLDIELPDISGHELAATIRQLDPESFVVMVTANNYLEDVQRAKQNEAKGFIAKPYSKDKILKCLTQLDQQRDLSGD